MPNDDLINALSRTYADMHSAGDLHNRLAGDPSIPPPTPYENVMDQARGLHSNLTHADPVEMAMGLLGPRVRIPNPIKAYHGSPHDFDKFDLSKIGTGEGAQAYGHGLYFAENPKVAETYKDLASQAEKLTIGGQPFNDRDPAHMAAWHAYIQYPGNRAAAIDRLENPIHDRASLRSPEIQADIAERLRLLRSGQEPKFDNLPSPKMYEVALHATPEQFLDWDKPLPGQRAAPLVEPLIRSLDETSATRNALNRSSGHDLYATMRGHQRGKELTETLREAGIPGIKYLDQGSRGAGQGTRNYVVWTPEIIEILRKYGLIGPAALGAASAAMPPDKAPQQ